jgi:hypothetical protein
MPNGSTHTVTFLPLSVIEAECSCPGHFGCGAGRYDPLSELHQNCGGRPAGVIGYWAFLADKKLSTSVD